MNITNINNAIFQPPKQFLCFEAPSLINFDLICEQLASQFSCTYVSYALELSNGKRIHYYSNREWQKVFIREKLIRYCPLLKFGRETQSNMLNWNSLSTFLNKQQQDVMEARKSFNIGNGIGTKQLVYGMQEMTTFASTVDNINFLNVFMNNINVFKMHVKSLRTLAIASMVTSGWLSSSQIIFNLQNIIKKSQDTQIH